MTTDIDALVERLESATADQQREMLEQAFVAIHGTKPPRVHGGSDELTAWLGLYNPFFHMLEAQAYESAAMALVPTDGSMTMVDLTLSWEPDDSAVYPACTVRWYPPHKSGPDWHARVVSAATPALAIASAILRARAALQGDA